MDADLENETWVVERGGEVAEKMADAGPQSLTDVERLIYCLWVVDYGMRNAGDLVTSEEVHPGFHAEGATLARSLGLSKALGLFSLEPLELEENYFELLTEVRLEIQKADALSPNTSHGDAREIQQTPGKDA
jgi:hypothetical protein